jgi:solute carrier family 35 protein F1/2
VAEFFISSTLVASGSPHFQFQRAIDNDQQPLLMSDYKHQTTVTSVANYDGEGSSPATAIDAGPSGGDSSHEAAADQIEQEKKGFFAYFKTKEFYITLILGYDAFLSFV